MASQLNSNNADFIVNATGTDNDLVFQQNGVETGRVGAGGFGKVLQVVNVNVGTVSTQALVANVLSDIIGLEAKITLKSLSSMVRVDVRWVGENSLGYAQQMAFNISRDDVVVGLPSGIGSRTPALTVASVSYIATEAASTPEMSNYHYYDTPSTASEITYKATITPMGTGMTLYNQRTVNDSESVGYPRFISSITLTEIGA